MGKNNTDIDVQYSRYFENRFMEKITYMIHSSFLPQQKLSAFLEKGDDDFDPSYSLVSHKHCYCW